MLLPRIGNIWNNLIYAGHHADASAEVRKQVLITSCFSLIGFLFMSFFGVQAMSQGHGRLAVVVLAIDATAGCNYLYLRLTGNYKLSARVIVIIMLTLSVYLLCTGGVEQTGPLWLFVLPPLIFYILGLRHGLILLVVLHLLFAIILYLPNCVLLTADYPRYFVDRFLASFFSLSAIACAYEYTREEGRKELLALSRRLDRLSRHDVLTGLFNRRHMLEVLAAEVDRFERNLHPFSVLLVDIDHFKLVNDRHGHEFGDAALRLVGRVLETNTQKRDIVARWGGEEFLILLPETNLRRAIATAERLRKAVAGLPLISDGESIPVTISIGIAEFQEESTIQSVIHRADRYLYQAKHRGRNRIAHPWLGD